MNAPISSRLFARMEPRLAGLALLLAASAADPAMAGAWSKTRTLQATFAASSPPDPPILMTNSQGHTVAAWNAVGYISYAEHRKGQPWTRSSTVVRGATGNAVGVAIGPDETTAIAWTTVATRYVPSKLLVSVREPGSSFATPAEIAPGVWVWYLKLGIAADGAVTLVWNDGGKVYASERPRGGPWSSPLPISTGAAPSLPDLAVNAAGAALAVWQEGALGNPSQITAAYRPAGGAWQAAAPVSTGIGASTWNPKPGLDAAGNAAVAYLENSAMMYAYRPAAGTWTAPEALAATGAGYPALAMNAAGDVVAAWQSVDAQGNTQVKARTKLAGAAWTAPLRLSGALETPGWPSAGFSDDGQAIVGWVNDAGQTANASVRNPVDASWHRRALGTGWWGSQVPVSAGGGSLGTGWAMPYLTNPNAATLVGKIFE